MAEQDEATLGTALSSRRDVSLGYATTVSISGLTLVCMDMSMSGEEALHISDLPDLRAPVFVAAFAGWNDAAQAATFALQTLLRLLGAEKFAEIEPEEFFAFKETRPMISLDANGGRQLTWPQSRFFAHHVPASERDLVLFLGTEPDLRWKTFCRIFTDLGQRLNASALVTLGALLTEVPHTLDTRLTGFASPPEAFPDITVLGIQASSYEGPTGIVGTLHDAWRTAGLPAVSLWGNVPHYISATPNPDVSLSLLRRLGAVLGIELPLGALEIRAKAFRDQIDRALEENPEAKEYVENLEAGYRDENPPAASPELIDELERYLRSTRPADDEDD